MSEPQDKVDVGSLKDTFLECPVCGEHFNQTDRRPRLLHSCFHAFCTQCLQQLLKKEGRGKITCPLCRTVEKVTGNAETLEVDSLRDKLVEFLQIKHDKKVLCSECLEKTAAVSRCEECQSYLCKECDFVHRRHRVSRDHSILSLNDVLKQPIQSFGKRHFCPNHPKHHLEFYCATEEKLCCVFCIVLDHRDHELQKLEEAAATRKEELDTKIKQVHAHVNRLREERKDGTQELKCIEEAKARSILDINRIFDDLKQSLDKRKHELIENVQRNSSSLSSVINKTMASHEQTLAMIESTDTYFAQAKQEADAVEMLEIYPSIKRSIDSLSVQCQSSKTRGNEDVYNLQFKPTKYENVLCLIREFGTFTKLPQKIFTEDQAPTHLDSQTALPEIPKVERMMLPCGQGKEASRSKRGFATDIKQHGDISFVMESGAAVAEGRSFTVKVYKESIVSLALDVIVNGANGQLSHIAGVARSIARAAGRQLEYEGNSIVLQRGDIPVTDLAVTNSGKLPCKWVFHAVGPRWRNYTDKESCLEDLCCTILRCLCEAVNRSFETIAFPSISSSIFAVPKDACAKMYVRALKSFDTVVERGSLKEVHFVDISETMVTIIQTGLQNTWSQPGKTENLTKDRAFIMKCLDSNTSASVTTLEVTPGEHKEKDNNAVAHWLGKSGSVSLRVVKDDILKIDADAILSWEDHRFSTTSPLHKLMNDAGGESYRKGRDKAHGMTKLWGDIAEGPGGSLPQKHVIFAIISSFTNNEDISKCLKKALDSCVKNKLANLILTKPPSKSAHRNVDITFIETTVDQLIKLDQDEKKPTLHVQIVDNQQHVVDGLMQRLQQYLISCGLAATAITSKETEVQGGEDCVICLSPMTDPVKLKCGHQFCKQCVDNAFKIKAVCPVCKMKCGEITGNMPPGTMRDRVDYFDLPGYKGCGTIIITYAFNDGHQTEEHPDPGQWYRGFTRTAYLPNNAEGQKVLSLLKVAWKRRLTFTIGRSVTMGRDSCITWNEIHHKTSTSGGPTNHGYPDPDYLRRVQEELADQGVTEEDLGATGTSVSG
ncbi:uncharacterized protein LOC124119043 [Haliotis rufescens]|uniref:uncharacterized protein LOC124119043 n=1 Tax=Haliotis rufescens TaxID=6454 RepID=UPI00201FA47A|nr:uncharacterized protein LOC124119043 [Haliotis rufescens]